MEDRAIDRLANTVGHLISDDTNDDLEVSDVAAKKNQKPIRVCVTGAAGQIAYSLIFMIAHGDMFGPKQKVIFHLLDIQPMMPVLQGVVMEIDDGAFPLVSGVIATADVKEAFTDVDVVILLGAFPRRPGMERKELLSKNAGIFTEQGKALDTYASKNVKVLVVGNPANTNCLIAMTCAPSIPRQNFSCLTRLDHNRAKSMLAMKIGTSVANIHNVVVWGNHSSTQYPDISHAYAANVPSRGTKTKLKNLVTDDKWLRETFVPAVQQRGAAIMKARKLSSAASAAQAITDHIRDWISGSKGEIVSMGVASDGSYGIKEGVIYSFPVICKNGKYKIVQGLEIDAYSRQMMDATAAELWEERDAAFQFIKN